LAGAQSNYEKRKRSLGTLKKEGPFIRRISNEKMQVDNIVFGLFIFNKLITAMFGPLDSGRWLENALAPKS